MNGFMERARELTSGNFVRDWSGKMIMKKPKMPGQKYNKKCPSCDSKKAAFFWKDEYYMAHCLCCGAYAPRKLLQAINANQGLNQSQRDDIFIENTLKSDD